MSAYAHDAAPSSSANGADGHGGVDTVAGVASRARAVDDGPAGPGPIQFVSPVVTVRRGCGTRDHHRIWYSWDICGMICSSMVYALDIGCMIAIPKLVVFPTFGNTLTSYAIVLFYGTLVVLGLTSHVKAMFSNPGAVPMNAKPVNPSHYDRHCHRCNNFKPVRAHHCSICKRCIVKMDHHCPWVATCVGVGNMKYFILFVMYIMLTCLTGLALIAIRFMSCLSVNARCDTTAGEGMGILIVTVIGVLFGLFTGCLFADQVNNILTNTTQIDRMKGLNHADPLSLEMDERLTVWHNLGEVFGGDPARDGWQWSWLVPTPIVFKDPEAVAGFCFRDVPRPRTTAEMEMV